MTTRKKHKMGIRHLHEALFSLNLAFFCLSLIFMAVPQMMSPFLEMELAIKKVLHIRQTDLVTGCISMAVSSLIAALFGWALLRVSANSSVTKEILRSVAGILAFFAIPVFFFNVIWSYGWPYHWAPFELAVALLCLVLYLRGKWRLPSALSIALVAAHFIFLWFFVGGNQQLCSYGGLCAPILSFLSAIIWGIYVIQDKTRIID